MKVKELRKRLRAFHPEAEVIIRVEGRRRSIHVVLSEYNEKIKKPEFRTIGIIVNKEGTSDAVAGHKAVDKNHASGAGNGNPQGGEEAEMDTEDSP